MSKTQQQQKPELKEWSADELRKEVYRLQHKNADLSRKLKAKEAIIESYDRTQEDRLVRKITDAIEQLVPYGAMRRF